MIPFLPHPSHNIVSFENVAAVCSTHAYRRWFLGVGLLNVIGLMLIIARMTLSDNRFLSTTPAYGHIRSVTVLFGISVLSGGNSLFPESKKTAGKPLSSSQWWRSLKKQKFLGTASVCSRKCGYLGYGAIYIKYTTANDLSPFLRTFLLGIGVLVPSALMYAFKVAASQSCQAEICPAIRQVFCPAGGWSNRIHVFQKCQPALHKRNQPASV